MGLWEVGEYVGEALVIIGVIGEVLADLPEPPRKKLAIVSSVMLIIGLVISLASLIRTNKYFDITIADLNAQAAASNRQARDAQLEAANARKETAQLQKDTQGLKTDADTAKRDMVQAQLELARLTSPVQSVPVIDGIAMPDPMKGLRLRILLHRDVRIKLPILAKGKSVTWTLFIVQDEKGDRQFSTFPHDVMFGNFMSHPPHSFCTMELVTDEHGTTDLTFGAASCPSNATDTTSK